MVGCSMATDLNAINMRLNRIDETHRSYIKH